MPDDQTVEQRKSIAWCGDCGNVSVDGINFGRVNDDLECAACGSRSPHFEYIRASSLGPQLTAEEAQGLLVDGFQTPDEVYRSARAKLSLIAQGEKP